MGRASKIRGIRDEIVELVAVIQVLKDMADNKFHMLAGQKDRFFRFGESFMDFFRLVSFLSVDHPLLRNDYPAVCILMVTSEGSFLGDINTKVVRAALEEKTKYPDSVLVTVGKKGPGLVGSSMKIEKTFENTDANKYDASMEVKDYLISGVMAKRFGAVVAIYPWPKNMNVIKPRIIKLLPCDELIGEEGQTADTLEGVIEESNPHDIIGYLGDMWISCRVYEMLYDMQIASSAAQAQQLESGLEKMKKEKKTIQLKYRVAQKADIDNSMREVFSSRMMTQKVRKK